MSTSGTTHKLVKLQRPVAREMCPSLLSNQDEPVNDMIKYHSRGVAVMQKSDSCVYFGLIAQQASSFFPCKRYLISEILSMPAIVSKSS